MDRKTNQCIEKKAPSEYLKDIVKDKTAKCQGQAVHISHIGIIELGQNRKNRDNVDMSYLEWN